MGKCWEWSGEKTNGGYGVIGTGKNRVRVHRLVASIWLGFDLDGPRCVCHKCDNPPCYNPAHLFVGTKGDNARDMVRKGRHTSGYGLAKSRKTHCPQGHPYTDAYIRNNGDRRCRICTLASNAKSKKRKVACLMNAGEKK